LALIQIVEARILTASARVNHFFCFRDAWFKTLAKYIGLRLCPGANATTASTDRPLAA
jgi:hypothetical protein